MDAVNIYFQKIVLRSITKSSFELGYAEEFPII